MPFKKKILSKLKEIRFSSADPFSFLSGDLSEKFIIAVLFSCYAVAPHLLFASFTAGWPNQEKVFFRGYVYICVDL